MLDTFENLVPLFEGRLYLRVAFGLRRHQDAVTLFFGLFEAVIPLRRGRLYPFISSPCREVKDPVPIFLVLVAGVHFR